LRTASSSSYGSLGRYELLARIAVGGMGEIFLARLQGAQGFEKFYVVKRILPHLADDPRFRTMLVDEARIASKMSHPNICQVYELGESSGQLFIAMEYLEGVTLLDAIRQARRSRHPMALGLVAGVLQQTCDALHYAHELTDRDGTPLQVIHRDVTPSNLFLTENGVVKILDFGIAKVRNASQNTQAGTVKGKYAYMAPEQMKAGAITPRVDVFACGVVGFEMLALHRLFQRRTDFLTFQALMEKPVPNIRDFRPEVPPPFAEVLARALERDPVHRYPTVRALSSAVQDAIVGHARPWSTGEIADYLRVAFRDELRGRAAAISEIVRYGGASGPRATLPMLVPIDRRRDGGSDDDPDDDFPSIETGVHEVADMVGMDVAAPVPVKPASSDSPRRPSTRGVSGAVPVVGAPASSPTATAAAPPRRGWLVAVAALAILVAGGVVMFALWLRRPTSSGGGTTQIIVERTTPDARPAEATLDARTAGSGAGAGPPDAATATARVDARPKAVGAGESPGAQVKRKLASRLGALQQCLLDAGASAGTTTLVFDVSTSGVASGATIRPDSKAVPCIRDVIHGIDFGAIPTAGRFEIPLKVK
jgi:serine/threonine protein kinase